MRTITYEMRVLHAGARMAAVLTIMAALHYFITPAEAAGLIGSTLATQVHVVAGGALALAAIAVNLREPVLYKLVLPLLGISIVILLINFPAASWYVGLFVAFIWMAAVTAGAFVAGRYAALFQQALTLLLCSWVAIFLLQFLLYFGSGTVVDFHQWLHPYSEARISTGWDGDVLRLTGPHIEPGTYSNWIYGLVLLRGLVRKRHFDLLNTVAVASTLLSFSLWGMLSACIYLLAALISSLKFNGLGSLVKWAAMLLVLYGTYLVVAHISAGDLSDYLVQRSTFDDRSGDSKLRAYDGFVSELTEVLIIGKSYGHDFCNGCESPQDAGVVINMIMHLGLLMTAAVIGVIGQAMYRTGGILALIAFVPVLFSKYYIYEPILWLIAGVALLHLATRRVPAPQPALVHLATSPWIYKER